MISENDAWQLNSEIPPFPVILELSPEPGGPRNPTIPNDTGDSAPRPYRTWKRPFGLVILGLLWSFEGLFNIAVSFVLFGPQDSFTLSEGSVLISSLILQDISLRLVLQALSILQIPAAY